MYTQLRRSHSLGPRLPDALSSSVLRCQLHLGNMSCARVRGSTDTLVRRKTTCALAANMAKSCSPNLEASQFACASSIRRTTFCSCELSNPLRCPELQGQWFCWLDPRLQRSFFAGAAVRVFLHIALAAFSRLWRPCSTTLALGVQTKHGMFNGFREASETCECCDGGRRELTTIFHLVSQRYCVERQTCRLREQMPARGRR